MTEEPIAVVRSENGILVLEDPVAEGVIAAVENANRKNRLRNCLRFLQLSKQAVEKFYRKFVNGTYKQSEYVIVMIDADDYYGKPLADALMPGHDWSEIRNRGEVPRAQGVAELDGVRSYIDIIDNFYTNQLQNIVDNGNVAVVGIFNEAVMSISASDLLSSS